MTAPKIHLTYKFPPSILNPHKSNFLSNKQEYVLSQGRAIPTVFAAKKDSPEKGETMMTGKLIDLYEKCAHESMDRRQFLRNVSVLAGSTAAAAALLPLLEGSRAQAQTTAKDAPSLVTEYLNYKGATGDVRAYFARQNRSDKQPAVLVIHENRGLVPHIEDVTRRIAAEGFLAFAPDALTPLGGTPKDFEKEGPALIAKLDGPATLQNYLAAVKFLKSHPKSTGKVGVVGFCWGGAMANQLAVNSPDVSAVVPYYGRQPASEDVPKIKAPLLLHYAAIDEGINKGIAAYDAALKKAGAEYTMYLYEGAQHAFNNDTNLPRYNREAAQLAWQRTIAFFKLKLRK